MVLVSAPKPVCVAGFARRARLVAGQSKVGMVEDIEELRVEAEGDVLRDRNLLRHV